MTGLEVIDGNVEPIDQRHAHAFRELESDIGDLALAANIAMRVSGDADLLLFAARHFEEVAEDLKRKYHELA